jgi:hypothetical protein
VSADRSVKVEDVAVEIADVQLDWLLDVQSYHW